MRDPLVGLGTGVVVVDGRGAYAISRALDDAAREERRRGRQIDPDVARLLEALRRLAHEHVRQVRSAAGGDEPASTVGNGSHSEREITVDEAADMLGMSARGVRDRIARGRLPARRAGRVWLLDPVDVADHTTEET